jgi:hypothetical protein
MDEEAYREAYRSANPVACPFAKAILSGRFGCSLAQGINLAERHAVGCLDAVACKSCNVLLERLRHNALFALKVNSLNAPIPHAKELKVQFGGLLGLQANLHPELAGAAGVANIHEVVEQAQARYRDLDDLPYSEIVKSIAVVEVRRRHSDSH